MNYPSSDAATNNSYSGNYALNAKWTLFDGGQRVQAIKQQEIQNTVDELGIEQNEDDIQISLIQTYMQVLYAMESVRINQNTVEVSTAQRDRAVELLRAGSISKVDLAQLESQLSTDKYQLVVAQTNLDNYKLQLKQLLELDITEEIELVMPELTEKDILTPLPSKQTIYNTSLAVMPQIKSSELAVDIAELEKKKAKGAFLPSLSMNAGLGTGHLSGTDYAFGSQIWNSFNESVGLTISIPIFSNRQYKTAYNKAKYAITTSQLELLNAQKQLLQTVEGIYLDATSSQTQYTSATERLSYVKESYNLIDADGEYGDYTYYLPNKCVKDNEENGTIRLSLHNDYKVRLTNNKGEEKKTAELSAKDFCEEVRGKDAGAYGADYKRPSEEAKTAFAEREKALRDFVPDEMKARKNWVVPGLPQQLQ